MKLINKIVAFSATVLMTFSMSAISASAAYDKTVTVYGNYGNVSVIKGSAGTFDRIFLSEILSYEDKTNYINARMTGTEYDKYYTFKSAYRIDGKTYDSTSGKNGTDERETQVKKKSIIFKYDKYSRGKKMNWANMRGYTYISNRKGTTYTNKASLKITLK